MFFIGPSPGADNERQLALAHSMPIYYDLDYVGEVSKEEQAKSLRTSSYSL